ncbi:hypothetical protein DICVIV_11267 [Dictyocaulus viviparus]|uniref:UBA domain-containing protein n=1 Tax=Dictyocaulus viviparus TaxID=29172 RepID=A0A0D8XDR9_DICVI|nr:hypothetical protein DICVIV_11267 [Dictyocaulus viviparus]
MLIYKLFDSYIYFLQNSAIQVIETTRCTQARAELALYDNDNDLAAAIDYILEHGSEIESWTEQKSKKDRKKDEEEKRPIRGQQSTRGRGGFGDRGGRGRGGRGEGVGSRGTFRGGATSGRGRGTLANSGTLHALQSKSLVDDSITKSIDNDSIDDGADWKSGPMVFHRSEDNANSLSISNTPVSVSQPSSAPAGPISFAAVAAAAVKKDLKRQQPQLSSSVTTNEPPALTSGTHMEYHNDGITTGNSAKIEQNASKDVFYR